MNPLLLLFLLLPIAEIATFIEVGDWIGAGPTVGLVILSAILGSVLIRWQGLSVLKRAQQAAERGESPVGAVFEGFCVVVAGLLLIIPGFLTDIVGILLFVRPVRNALGRWLFDRMKGAASFQMHGRMGGQAGGQSWNAGDPNGPHGGPHRGPGNRPPPGVIDVDYQEVDPEGGRPGSAGPADRDGPDDMPKLGDSRWAPPGSPHRNDRG
ncbi:FxsA family protein [Azospirillum argentinense]|uniref:FxsA family protein n=1 Tax=Azospirillum argentinense TaxID=2970906 RepID=A0A4D8P9N7_9PROT|nr:FxsA family protein [Azospirillum argentinense]QCN95533.1 FxsA family protein [Azospirillum argentinense]